VYRSIFLLLCLVSDRVTPGYYITQVHLLAMVSDRHQITVRVRVSSRVRVAVQFGSLSAFVISNQINLLTNQVHGHATKLATNLYH